jgi:hypothetical protein
MSRKPSDKGICQVCGKKGAISLEGLVQSHKVPKTKIVCLGSKLPPLEYSCDGNRSIVETYKEEIRTIYEEISKLQLEGAVVVYHWREYFLPVQVGKKYVKAESQDHFIDMDKKEFDKLLIETPNIFNHLTEITFDEIKRQRNVYLLNQIKSYERKIITMDKLYEQSRKGELI